MNRFQLAIVLFAVVLIGCDNGNKEKKQAYADDHTTYSVACKANREKPEMKIEDLRLYDGRYLGTRWPELSVVKIENKFLHIDKETYIALERCAGESKNFSYANVSSWVEVGRARKRPPIGFAELVEYDGRSLNSWHYEKGIVCIGGEFVHLQDDVDYAVRESINNCTRPNDPQHKLDCLVVMMKLAEHEPRKRMLALMAEELKKWQGEPKVPLPAETPVGEEKK